MADPVREVPMGGKNLWHKLLDFIEHPLFLWAAAIVAALVGYFIYPVLVVCGICVMLAFHRAKVVADQRRRLQIISYTALFIVTTAALMVVGNLIKKHIPQIATLGDIRELMADSQGTGLRNSQLKELQQIDEFISRKDEIELRETFDFPKILKYNIRMAKIGLAPALVSKSESDEMNAFFKGGQGRLDLRYVHVSSVNNRAQVDWIPGKIGVLNTSAKYNENRRLLTEYLSSAQLPSDVGVALKDFDTAVEDNSVLMIGSLNDSLASDPRIIVYDDTYSSNWYGSASGLYWQRFIPLKPKADAIRSAIRAALGVK